MSGPNDFTNQNIEDTYQRVLQISSSGQVTDGTGSLAPILQVTASHAISASVEILKEVSSSHADRADEALMAVAGPSNATFPVFAVSASNTIQGLNVIGVNSGSFSYIQSSGDISASGAITASALHLPQLGKIEWTSNSGQAQTIKGTDNYIKIDGDNRLIFNADVDIEINSPDTATDGNISAEGDISASGVISGSNIVKSLSTGTGTNVTLTLHDGTTFTRTINNVTNATNATNATTADCSNQISTVTCATDAERYITFVDDNNTEASCETLKTNQALRYNCRRRMLIVDGGIQSKGSDITIMSGSISMSGDLVITGSISSSGTQTSLTFTTGSFNHIITDGDTIEFRNPANGNKIGHLKFDPTDGMQIGGPQSAFGLVDLDGNQVETFNAPLRANKIIAKNKVETKKVDSANVNLDLVSGGDIILDAAGADIKFDQDNSTYLHFDIQTNPKITATGELSFQASGTTRHNFIGKPNSSRTAVTDNNFMFGGMQGYEDVILVTGDKFQANKTAAVSYTPGGLRGSSSTNVSYSHTIPKGFRVSAILVLANVANTTVTVYNNTSALCKPVELMTLSTQKCPTKFKGLESFEDIATNLTALQSNSLLGRDGNHIHLSLPITDGFILTGAAIFVTQS